MLCQYLLLTRQMTPLDLTYNHAATTSASIHVSQNFPPINFFLLKRVRATHYDIACRSASLLIISSSLMEYYIYCSRSSSTCKQSPMRAYLSGYLAAGHLEAKYRRSSQDVNGGKKYMQIWSSIAKYVSSAKANLLKL